MAGKRLKDWRAGIRSFQVESPTKQYLHDYRQQRRAAAGPRLLPALGSRLRSWPPPWAGPSGLAAMSSGRAGLPGQALALGGAGVRLFGS